MSEASRRGQVFQRGRTWTFVVDIAPQGAARKQVKRGGFASKTKALEAMRELSDQVIQRQYAPVDKKMTLRTYALEHFLPAKTVEGKKPSTLDQYERLLRTHILPLIGDLPLASVTTGIVDRLYALALSGHDGRGPLGANSVRKIHQLLSSVFKHAIRKGALKVNPCDNATAPSTRAAARPQIVTWTSEELSYFLKAVRDDELYALWHILAMTGLRRGEALGLQWSDLNLKEGFLRVNRTVGMIGTSIDIGTPKTLDSRRKVELAQETVDCLRRHWATQGELRLALGQSSKERTWVFSNANGEHLMPKSVSRKFEVRARHAGLRRIRLHDLRHTHATLALEAGVDIKVVSERLGHANTSVTLNIYAHTTTVRHRAAAETFAALIAERR